MSRPFMAGYSENRCLSERTKPGPDLDGVRGRRINTSSPGAAPPQEPPLDNSIAASSVTSRDEPVRMATWR
jgi:hypothetical protein